MSCLFLLDCVGCHESLVGDCICFVCFFISRTLDSNVDGFEQGDFEECEEVQGQIAKQGKPPLLVAYLDPIFLIMQVFPLCLFQDALFYNCYYLLIAIHLRLGSTSHLISSLR
jgi:hypothetical protein